MRTHTGQARDNRLTSCGQQGNASSRVHPPSQQGWTKTAATRAAWPWATGDGEICLGFDWLFLCANFLGRALAQTRMEARIRAAAHNARAALRPELGEAPVSDQWLYVHVLRSMECIQHLWAQTDPLHEPTRLHAAVRAQFLASRLADSMDHAQVHADHLPTSLVLQITAITDVGVSAQTLLDTLHARRTQQPPPAFPRQMLRLQLEDGFGGVINAYEHTRIPDLLLGETPLGCKVRLQHAQREKGVVFLEPRTITVLGGTTPDLAQHSNRLLEEQLCAQLGIAPSQPKDAPAPTDRNVDVKTATGPVDDIPGTTISRPRRAPTAPASAFAEDVSLPVDSFSDAWDIDAEEALLEAELAMAAVPQGRMPDPAIHKMASPTPSPTVDKCESSTAEPISSGTRSQAGEAAPAPMSSGTRKSQLLRHLDAAPIAHTPPPRSARMTPPSSGEASARLKILPKHDRPPPTSSQHSAGPIVLSSDTEPEADVECIVLSDSDSAST